MKPPRIYDGFCFFNEAAVLRLRLETLWDTVDTFLLVESTLTHAGTAKPLFYRPEDFHEFSSKIRHILVDSHSDDTTDHWRNENLQRNAIEQGLYDARPEDWIMVGDVDEIPNPEHIRDYEPARFVRGVFDQRYFAYKLNNCSVDRNGQPVSWLGTKITTIDHFRCYFGCAQEVRIFKSRGPWRAFRRKWLERFGTQKIKKGGWHFSWMTGVDGIVLKLESFAHQEFNRSELKDPLAIAEHIECGEDVLNLGGKFRVLPIDESFPRPLRESPDYYLNLLSPVRAT